MTDRPKQGQIPVREENIVKTAFVTMDRHFDFLKMQFEMMNSGATLIRTMKMLSRRMYQVMDYVDDLLVHTPTWEDRMGILKELPRRLKQANFTLRPTKCVLGPGTIDFFGHRLKRGSNRSSGRERGESSGCPKTQDQHGGL
ncbi:Zinc finger protein [Plakobranchus ocellatus]|uniref:Zinc finger protein n=1 Tax=Plakobranchus ocellatus TaxID=259542 RepID=A0AAV4CR71_9GAST|nr:Zinc finger protein [Plakobranchus ocellatus]